MMMMKVIQDIKVIEVSGFERRMFWYLILLMDPYCAGRGDEASKLKINIASCCLKGPKRRSTNGYCWRRCHHRHCHHDYNWCHLWCAVRVFTSLTFSIWNRLLLMTSTVIMNTKRKEQLLIIINSTPHTHSYLPLFLFKMYNDFPPGPRYVLARGLLEVRLLRLQTWRGDQLTTIILAS